MTSKRSPLLALGSILVPPAAPAPAVGLPDVDACVEDASALAAAPAAPAPLALPSAPPVFPASVEVEEVDPSVGSVAPGFVLLTALGGPFAFGFGPGPGLMAPLFGCL